MKICYPINILVICIVFAPIIFAVDSKEFLHSIAPIHEFPHREPVDRVLFDIVVSHCRAPISWLARELAGLPKDTFQVRRIFIYSKCGQQPVGVDLLDQNLISTITLPNVGRCDHTYAYHLAHFYHDLSPHVVFLKDSYYISAISKQRSLLDLMIGLRDHWFTCGREPIWKQSVWHGRQRMWRFRLPVYVTAEDRSGGKTQYDVVDKRVAWRGPESLSFCGMLRQSLAPEDLQELAGRQFVPACYGGSFGTATAMIRRYDQETWSRFESALSRTDNIEEGHFMERLWASLLSPPADKNLTIQLERSSFNPHDAFHDFSSSYRGSLVICSSDPCDLPLTPPIDNPPKIFAGPPKLQAVIVTPSLQADHAQQYLFLLAVELKQMGYRVVVISPTGHGLEKELLAAGIEVNLTPKFTHANPKYTMAHFFTILEEMKIDPTYVFWNTIHWASLLNTHLRYKQSIPRFVWIIHEFQIDEHSVVASQYQVLRHYESRVNLQENLDAIVFLSDRQREQWIFTDTGNTYVIPGFSRYSLANYPHQPDITRASLGIPEKSFVITMVGPFLPRKRQHWMFDLLDALASSPIEVRVLLIGAPHLLSSGDPNYAKQITSKAALPSYQQRLVVIPFTQNPFPYLALSDLHISASVEDAFPLNVVEAMSMGVPVLSPNAGGVAELYSEKTKYFLIGNLTEPFQLTTKTKVMLKLHQAGELKKYGKVFQQSVKYGHDRFADQLSLLLQRLDDQLEEISVCNMLEIPEYFQKLPRPPTNGVPNPRTVIKLNSMNRLSPRPHH